MKREAEVKELLINNTIRLIAEGGFEKATVKEITKCGGDLPDVKMNEVYIYRIFGGKENLYRAVFARLDSDLFYKMRSAYDAAVADETAPSFREKVVKFFEHSWKFIMGHEANCRCYVRYYYSVYFCGASQETHHHHFENISSKASVLFKDEADVGAILHSVFTALLSFAIQAYNGDLEDNEINRPHIFNVLYCMMATYFKDDLSGVKLL